MKKIAYIIATEMMFCVALDELNYAVTGHTGSFYGAFLSSIELEFTVCFFPDRTAQCVHCVSHHQGCQICITKASQSNNIPNSKYVTCRPKIHMTQFYNVTHYTNIYLKSLCNSQKHSQICRKNMDLATLHVTLKERQKVSQVQKTVLFGELLI